MVRVGTLGDSLRDDLSSATATNVGSARPPVRTRARANGISNTIHQVHVWAKAHATAATRNGDECGVHGHVRRPCMNHGLRDEWRLEDPPPTAARVWTTGLFQRCLGAAAHAAYPRGPSARHTHVCTHVCTCVHTHVYTHVYAHFYTHINTHVDKDVYIHVYTRVYMHVHAHVYTYVYAHVYTHTCLCTCLSCTHLHTCLHPHTCMHAHVCIQCMHAVCTQIHARARAHTHTCAQKS